MAVIVVEEAGVYWLGAGLSFTMRIDNLARHWTAGDGYRIAGSEMRLPDGMIQRGWRIRKL